jgi:hypothetical protein
MEAPAAASARPVIVASRRPRVERSTSPVNSDHAPSERATIAIIARNAAKAANSIASCANPKARRPMTTSRNKQAILICSCFVRVKFYDRGVVGQFEMP